jgi:hypothetical protein
MARKRRNGGRKGDDPKITNNHDERDNSSSNPLDDELKQQTFPPHFRGMEEKNSTGRSLSTTNLAYEKITIETFNQNLISSNYLPVYRRDSEIVLTVLPQLKRLVYQSICWADKVLSIPHVRFKTILDGSYPSAWRQQLVQLHMYSYFDMLYSVLWRSERNMIGSNSLYVIGHCIMASAIINPVHSFTCEEHSATFKIEFDDSDIKAIENVVNSIGWLVPLVQTRFNEKYIYCPVRTRQLQMLGDALNGNADSPALVRFTPGSFDSLENFGKYLTLDNFAIGNSFFDSRGPKKFWYISGGSRLDSNSMLFGKSLFFTIKRESVDFPNSTTYSSLTTNDSGRLIRFELEHVNGCIFRDITVFPDNLSPYTCKILYNGEIDRGGNIKSSPSS